MDDLFTVDNPGHWADRDWWPRYSVWDERARDAWLDTDGAWKPWWVPLLEAVDQCGKKMWGDRWRAPPFASTDTASLPRFMHTIKEVRTLCARGVLDAMYETLESTGPNGRFDPGQGDDLVGRARYLAYDDWYGPDRERMFLLGTVRSGPEHLMVDGHWLYVNSERLRQYIANLQPQQDEPAAAPTVESSASRPRPLSLKTAKEVVSNYLNGTTNPTVAGAEQAASDAGFKGGRDFIRNEFKSQITLRTGQPPKQGRRPNLPK
jgi:hypothetical protein